MAGPLEPIDIKCDAPPYSVVGACKELGFLSPLDVRWCRRSHLAQEAAGRGSFLSLQKLKALFGLGKRRDAACICGHPLPILESYTFLFISQKQSRFLLGQCAHCKTIFWEPS